MKETGDVIGWFVVYGVVRVELNEIYTENIRLLWCSVLDI
jgi:hypothetical protein